MGFDINSNKLIRDIENSVFSNLEWVSLANKVEGECIVIKKIDLDLLHDYNYVNKLVRCFDEGLCGFIDREGDQVVLHCAKQYKDRIGENFILQVEGESAIRATVKLDLDAEKMQKIKTSCKKLLQVLQSEEDEEVQEEYYVKKEKVKPRNLKVKSTFIEEGCFGNYKSNARKNFKVEANLAFKRHVAARIINQIQEDERNRQERNREERYREKVRLSQEIKEKNIHRDRFTWEQRQKQVRAEHVKPQNR